MWGEKKKERMREWKKSYVLCIIPQMTTIAIISWAVPCQNRPKSGIRSLPSTSYVGTGTHGTGPSSTAFQHTLTGSWSRSGRAHVKFQHWKCYNLCHTTGPEMKILFHFKFIFDSICRGKQIFSITLISFTIIFQQMISII